jgi:ubiquinone/menaquinone biosynthesis C-methylase UbiE
MTDLHQHFQTTSDATDLRAAFRFLDHLDGFECTRAYKKRMHELLALQPGDEVLDVGCGVGHEAQRIAEIVGPAGRCVGLDQSGEMIAEARRRAEGRDPRPTFVVSDAERMPLEAGRFRACWSERVLMYVREPAAVVGEMVRVLQPGGRLVDFDFDYDALLFDTPDPAIARKITHALADALPSGKVGRRLPRLFREAGLRDVTVEAHIITGPFDVFQRLVGGAIERLLSSGALDRADVDAWWHALVERSTLDENYALWLGFIVSGRKPSD